MTEIERAKKVAETARKLDAAKRELKRKEGYLTSDIRSGRDTGRNGIEVKYAAERLRTLQNELDRLK